jgi:hypothetical protein
VPEHVAAYYPTSYVDHDGVDWHCDDLTLPGHRGSDFGAGGFVGMDEGRTVTAASAGRVVATNDGEYDRCSSGTCAGGAGFGNYVQIEHDDGRTTLYAHLAQFSVQVGVGDLVKCGQALGRMGSSGYSTGPHLHFEVRDASGAAVDPFTGSCSVAPTSWTDQADYGEIPGLGCGVPGGCTPVGELACGSVVLGATDEPGATTETWQYGCSDWTYSGPEMSWTFVTTLDEPVTVALDQLTADLDVYVLGSDDCDGSGCVAASTATELDPENLTFDAVAKTPYTIVVDGWEGAVGPFRLEVRCEGPPVHPPDTGDPGPGTGDTAGPAAPAGPGDPDAAGGGAGCAGGCATGSGTAPLLVPWWVALVLRRRSCGSMRHGPPPPVGVRATGG